MKNKIVIWGEDANDKKVLITLELKEFENNVLIHVFPEEVATEEFYSNLMGDWKNDKPIDFPNEATVIERPLSVSESLLPDELKTDKTDVLTRAQAEWHFTVLSSKLYQMYKSELDEYKDKIDSLTTYSEEMWTEMKTFWEKVQGQVRERNMFRDHAATLKERTNNLFEKLKNLRKELKKELEAESQILYKKFNEEIDEVEAKIEKGLALSPVFNELKEIQGRFFKEKFTRKDKDSLWKRIDTLFKKVKELKYGDKGGKGNKTGSRIKSRYEGLLKAIQRMENSINYDKKDVAFQNNKISTTDGQLEMQIRQAKLVMIEERLKSKQAKLDDMYKTKKELIKLLEKEKQREEQHKINLEKEKVKESLKQKIADEIKTTQSELEDQEEDLIKAAEAIKESKKRPKKKVDVVISKENNVEEKNVPSKLETISEAITQKVEDVSDTVAAVAEVLEDKIENFVDKFKSEEE